MRVNNHLARVFVVTVLFVTVGCIQAENRSAITPTPSPTPALKQQATAAPAVATMIPTNDPMVYEKVCFYANYEIASTVSVSDFSEWVKETWQIDPYPITCTNVRIRRFKWVVDDDLYEAYFLDRQLALTSSISGWYTLKGITDGLGEPEYVALEPGVLRQDAGRSEDILHLVYPSLGIHMRSVLTDEDMIVSPNGNKGIILASDMMLAPIVTCSAPFQDPEVYLRNIDRVRLSANDVTAPSVINLYVEKMVAYYTDWPGLDEHLFIPE